MILNRLAGLGRRKVAAGLRHRSVSAPTENADPIRERADARCLTAPISVDASAVPAQYASYADHAGPGDRRCNAVLEWDSDYPGTYGQPVVTVIRAISANEAIRLDYGPHYR